MRRLNEPLGGLGGRWWPCLGQRRQNCPFVADWGSEGAVRAGFGRDSSGEMGLEGSNSVCADFAQDAVGAGACGRPDANDIGFA